LASELDDELIWYCLRTRVDGGGELVAQLLAIGRYVMVIDEVAGFVLLVVLVAAFSLPGQCRVVAVGVKLGAHQRVTYLEFVVQKAKGQIPVHGFNPKGHAP
jgi:hypothetical protein